MIAQVSHDHALLAERIARLTGAEGAARLEAALAHVRQQVAAELQAAEDAASEASWETASEAGVRCGGGVWRGVFVSWQRVVQALHQHHKKAVLDQYHGAAAHTRLASSSNSDLSVQNFQQQHSHSMAATRIVGVAAAVAAAAAALAAWLRFVSQSRR